MMLTGEMNARKIPDDSRRRNTVPTLGDPCLLHPALKRSRNTMEKTILLMCLASALCWYAESTAPLDVAILDLALVLDMERFREIHDDTGPQGL